jgi:hypothetical protein
MDLPNILAKLRKEREALDVVISNLEHLEQAGRRGPGRPPNLVVKSATNGTSHGYRSPDLPADEG